MEEYTAVKACDETLASSADCSSTAGGAGKRGDSPVNGSSVATSGSIDSAAALQSEVQKGRSLEARLLLGLLGFL